MITGHVWSGGDSNREPSGRVLASSAGGPGFNPQSKTVSFERRYKIGPVVSLVSTEHLKGKYWRFLMN